MSDKNLPEVVKNSDFTKEDENKLAVFMQNGTPGVNLADEATIMRMMDLYLAGKTYSQIARINRVKKEVILYYSKELGWFNLKQEYLVELENHLKDRIVNAKVASQDFLLQLSHMYQKKIGAKMDRYLKTNDEVEADKINLKEIDKYLKIVEALHKISETPSKAAPAPAVGINVGDGVTVVKQDDGTVEITPKQKTVGNMLEQLANKRRDEEMAKLVKNSDIKEKDVTNTKSEGDKNEK